MRKVLLPVLGLLTAACGGSATPAADARMTVDTVDGVVHFSHTGRAPTAVLEPLVRLGEAGGFADASPYEFGRIRSLAADAAGRIYVADALALEIRVFGPDGEHIGSLGRKGGGPGELEGLHGAVWLADDRLVAGDFGNARLAILDLDGRQIGQWPWLRITGNTPFLHSSGPGELYAFGIRSTGEAAGGRQRVESVWVRYHAGGPVDTVAIPRLDDRITGSGAVCEGDGIGSFSNPFSDRLLAVPAPHGERVVAMASDYRLAFIDQAGDTVRTLARDADPVPLSDDEWRETEEGYAEFRRQWRGASCTGEVRRPRHHPVLRDIAFDHHARLMVELNTAVGPALDLYDHDRGWIATIPLPDRDRNVPLFLRDDRLYLATRDSLGVQRVEAFHVTLP